MKYRDPNSTQYRQELRLNAIAEAAQQDSEAIQPVNTYRKKLGAELLYRVARIFRSPSSDYVQPDGMLHRERMSDEVVWERYVDYLESSESHDQQG